ncbi:MAG: hypothetical protein Q4D06_04830 [Coriobacteriia bacterium]|nr:hypothetical protein [Coriobacteriia bacterium]
MDRDFERRWELMKQVLGSEARGESVRPCVSTRTLFGIRSTVEQQLDDLVAQEEERRRQERLEHLRREREGVGERVDDRDGAD